MSHHFRCDNTTALVQTDKGAVKGYAYDGLLIFKGIPYAKARRFHAPVPPGALGGRSGRHQLRLCLPAAHQRQTQR